MEEFDFDLPEVEDDESMTTDDNFAEILENQSEHINDINDGAQRTQLIVDQKKSIVDRYYKIIKEKYGLDTEYIDYTNFELGPNNKKLFLKVNGKEIQITSKRGNEFIALSTLAGKIGPGGTDAIKDILKLPNYKKTITSTSCCGFKKCRKYSS